MTIIEMTVPKAARKHHCYSQRLSLHLFLWGKAVKRSLSRMIRAKISRRLAWPLLIMILVRAAYLYS